MAVIPFADYRPDLSDINASYSSAAANVVPRADGYGPVKSLEAFTAALPAPCRGAFQANLTDGTIKIFAGTASDLYVLDNSTLTWTVASKGGVSYSEVPFDAHWQFAQFNNFIIAVQQNTPPQYWDVSISTLFDDLSGSPPAAGGIAIVGRFVVLYDLTSAPNTIQWSGLNAVTTWTAGTNYSDSQQFPDGGRVRGVAGGEFGLVMQQNAIRRMIYVPGSPLVFQIERIADDRGIYAPYSLCRGGERIFFLGSNGFVEATGDGALMPIGFERVDRTVFEAIDTASLHLCIGAVDPRRYLVWFAFKSATGGTAGQFDRVVAYNWQLKRWSPITLSGEYLATVGVPGVTLEGLDADYPDIDAMTTSLDALGGASLPALAAFNTSNELAYFTGAALEAVAETQETIGTRQRVNVNGAQPITDAADVRVSVGGRDKLNGALTYGSESQVDADGFCPLLEQVRSGRMKVRIPAGETWTHLSGVEPELLPAGRF